MEHIRISQDRLCAKNALTGINVTIKQEHLLSAQMGSIPMFFTRLAPTVKQVLTALA
jgi:hypothetical protein